MRLLDVSGRLGRAMQLGALFCASHEGIQRSFSCRFAAPCSMKIASPPWTRGDFRGVLNTGTKPPRRNAPPLPRRGFSEETPSSPLNSRFRALQDQSAICRLFGPSPLAPLPRWGEENSSRLSSCALVIKHKFLPRQHCPCKVLNRFSP